MAVRFVTVSVEILRDTNLTPNEKFILAEIEQLTQLDLGCIASNQHFADLLQIARANASRTISNLEKKGYISTEIKKGSRNMVRSIKMIKGCYQNDTEVVSKCLETKGNRQSNKQKRETKPTLAQIEAYINEKNLSVSATKFFNYFEAGDWIDANGKQVKNWKQKLLTWDNHSKDNKDEGVRYG